MYNNRDIIAGVVGGSGIGRVHIREICGNEFVKKVYLVNSNFESSIKLSVELSKKFDLDVKPLKCVNEMAKKVNFVSICTPNDTHIELIKLFLKCNCHVFVEKPLFWKEKLTNQSISLICKSLFKLADGKLKVNYPTYFYKNFLEGHYNFLKEIKSFFFLIIQVERRPTIKLV